VSDEYMSTETATAFCDEARQALARAEQERRAAAKDLAAASYEREQTERRHRDIAELEANISRREAKLKELGEAALLEREAAADAKLRQAEELLARYDKDRHRAVLALAAIDQREREARGEREARRNAEAA
jgi:hypothetical protein